MIDQTMMESVAGLLMDLREEYGQDAYDNPKVQIPRNRDQAMSFLKKWSYEHLGSFDVDDGNVVVKARQLVKEHGRVFVVANTATLQYELYVPPGT